MAEKNTETANMAELTKDEEKMLVLETEKEFARLSFKDKMNIPSNLKLIVVAILLFDLMSAVACLLLGDVKGFGMVLILMLVFAWLGWFFFGNTIKNRIYFEKKLQYLQKKSKG